MSVTAALGLAVVQATRLTPPLSPSQSVGEDVQARPPGVPVGLSRVGVTGVEKVVRIRDELFFARLECFVDLSREQKGAHMSRFEEVVNEAIGEVVLSESPFRAETLAQHIAELVRARQGAERAEVTIAARYPEHRPAPVSGVQTQEIYTLRGRATLQIGCIEECVAEIDASALLEIAEASMSSEIYELMKRSDEVEVVEKAHARPRFVEDCVREMIAGVVTSFPGLDGASFVSARQENLETIHQHNVVAERHGLLSELRGEIDSGHPASHQTTLEEWLNDGSA